MNGSVPGKATILVCEMLITTGPESIPAKVFDMGQISVPVEIRRKLGIGPGSVPTWDEGRRRGDRAQSRPV